MSIVHRDPLFQPRTDPVAFRSSADEIRVDQRRNEAMEMVVNWTPVTEVAKHFGVSKKTIYAWIELKKEALRQSMSKNALVYKARLNKTYDQLMRQWIPLALVLSNDLKFEVDGIKMVKGKPVHVKVEDYELALAATDRILKIAKQQAELNQIGPIPDDKPVGGGSGDVNLQLIQIIQNAVKQPPPVKEVEIIEIDQPPVE